MVEGTAIERLVATATQGLSGEFISANDQSEAHIFFQEGRVAWANNSLQPFAFSQYLREVAKIDAHTFGAVVEECRQTKKPIGETLVRLNLASKEMVRLALAHQIQQTIVVVNQQPRPSIVFLPRKFQRYDNELTFEVQEFLAELTTIKPNATPLPLPHATDGLIGIAKKNVEGADWVQIFEGHKLLSSQPQFPERISRNILQNSVLGGALFAVLRSNTEAVVGARVRGKDLRSVWCGVENNTRFGPLVASMWPIVASGSASGIRAQTQDEKRSVRWRMGDGNAALRDNLINTLSRAPEVLAAFVLESNKSREEVPVLAIGFGDLDVHECLEPLKQSAACLHDWQPSSEPTAPDAGRNIATAWEKAWCFGSEVKRSEKQYVLAILFDRHIAQGVGWAYLSTFRRMFEETA